MKVVIIFAHPNNKSFCAALLKQFVKGLNETGHKYRIHNLYEDNFNPVLSREELLEEIPPAADPLVAQYQEDLLWSEMVTIIHPAYWYGVPAILKGYFDRVLYAGFAHEFVNDEPVPRLTGKKGLLVQTFDAEEHKEKEIYGDITFRTVEYTWRYCGVTEWQRKSMFRVLFSTIEERKKWLKEIFMLGKSLNKKS